MDFAIYMLFDIMVPLDMKLCSACLLGVNCRYDGRNKLNRGIVKLSAKETLIPVCPEELGGLSTPRESSERKGNRIVTKSGKDVTANFKKGARKTLEIAKTLRIRKAILKEKSAACGSNGVTTQLLQKHGIKVIMKT